MSAEYRFGKQETNGQIPTSYTERKVGTLRSAATIVKAEIYDAAATFGMRSGQTRGERAEGMGLFFALFGGAALATIAYLNFKNGATPTDMGGSHEYIGPAVHVQEVVGSAPSVPVSK